MRNLLFTSSILVISLFFTGCYKFNLGPSYVINDRSEKFNIQKEKSKALDVNIISSKQQIFTTKYSSLHTVYCNITPNLMDNITKDFFSQYFEHIKINTDFSSNSLNIQVNPLKCEALALRNTPKFELSLKIKVLNKKQEILNKIYTYQTNAPTMIETKHSTFHKSPTEISIIYWNKVIHAGLFNLLEIEFKKDLLKALEENI